MKLSFLASIILLISCSANSAENALPEPIQALEKQGFEIKGQFAAPSGLEAYAMSYQGQGTTVYLTPDRQHAIMGNMVDKTGKNVSEDAIEQYVYAPLAKEMWARLEQQKWIAIGNENAPRTVYMFADPYCPYCSEFWQQVQPWVAEGKVQLRVLLVAMLKPESRTTAAAILMAKDPAVTLAQYENSQGKALPTQSSAPSPQAMQILQNNLELMDQLGGQATPAIYYLNQDGRLQQHQGKPDEASLELIMGTPLAHP